MSTFKSINDHHQSSSSVCRYWMSGIKSPGGSLQFSSWNKCFSTWMVHFSLPVQGILCLPIFLPGPRLYLDWSAIDDGQISERMIHLEPELNRFELQQCSNTSEHTSLPFTAIARHLQRWLTSTSHFPRLHIESHCPSKEDEGLAAFFGQNRCGLIPQAQPTLCKYGLWTSTI